MKALVLGLVLALPFSPFLPQEQEEATLSLMPPAATGISHGYALWTTGQIGNPYGCVFGSASPETGVIVYRAGAVDDPASCAEQENAIGMLIFVHEQIPQEKVCEAARVVRADHPKLVLLGAVYGLKIETLLSGDDYASPLTTWCATPIESELFYRLPQRTDEVPRIS